MIRVVCEDIAKLEVDAIVNATNSQLLPGKGVDAAIRRGAGHELVEAMDRLGGCPVGEARLTLGFHLPSKYVIHTVGPIWQGGDSGEAELLRSCYRACFKIAMDNDMRSMAFPCIATGVFGYPKREAAEIALSEIDSFENRFFEIVICCHNQDDETIYLDLLGSARGDSKRD